MQNINQQQTNREALDEQTDAISSRERISGIVDDWYLKIGAHTSLEGRETELLTKAADLYVLVTGVDNEFDTMTQKDRVDHYSRLAIRSGNPADEVFLSPRDGLMVGALTLELASLAEGKYKINFLERAQKIFSTVSQDVRPDTEDFGGTPKHEARKYYFGAKIMVVQEKLKQGDVSYEDAEAEMNKVSSEQAKLFLTDLTNYSYREGELYEQYIEILARHANWSDQEMDQWYIRSATPREDYPDLGYEGARLATDMFIVDEKTEKESAIQVKLRDDYKPGRYDEERVLVYVGDAYTSEIRKHMESVVKAIRASYGFKETEAEAALLDSETDYLRRNMINKAR